MIEPTAVPRAAYSTQAGGYDKHTKAFQGSRDRIVEVLEPASGEVVLDVGCGTGLCFDALRAAVGPDGGVVGIDEAAQMAQLARRRTAQRGWDNVAVVQSPVERADIPVVADRALFCAAHDILQSVDALRNVLAHLVPGGRVVAGGGKFSAPWMLPLNLQAMALHAPYVRSFAGFSQPWAKLAPFLTDLRVDEFAFGTGYVASGRVRSDLPASGQASAR